MTLHDIYPVSSALKAPWQGERGASLRAISVRVSVYERPTQITEFLRTQIGRLRIEENCLVCCGPLARCRLKRKQRKIIKSRDWLDIVVLFVPFQWSFPFLASFSCFFQFLASKCVSACGVAVNFFANRGGLTESWIKANMTTCISLLWCHKNSAPRASWHFDNLANPHFTTLSSLVQRTVFILFYFILVTKTKCNVHMVYFNLFLTCP